jgi:lysophospholipase L1-like esterase
MRRVVLPTALFRSRRSYSKAFCAVVRRGGTAHPAHEAACLVDPRRRGNFAGTHLNWKRFSLVVLAACALAAVLAWAKTRESVDEHRRARQLVLYYTLGRINDPVIVIGDSIVEASTLPRSICGHAIVNAGLNGASTASDLGNWLAPALDGKRAALIVVSLGTNDALTSAPSSEQTFADRYGALLALLSKLTPRLAVLQIPPVEARDRMTVKMQDEARGTINIYNSVLPGLAGRNGAIFVALPAMPEAHTIDGVHLNAEGYQAWDKAVMQAAATVCG